MFSVYSEEMYHSQIISCCFMANLCNPILSSLAIGGGGLEHISRVHTPTTPPVCCVTPKK